MELARIYDACGMPILPDTECVPLLRIYRVPIILAAGEVKFDISQVMERDFLWRGYGVNRSDRIKIRFRAAKQYYLQNARVLVPLLASAGYEARALEPEFIVPKGQAVTIEAENPTDEAVNTYVVLLGVDIEVPNY